MTQKDKAKKLNCWEFKKCGREEGGVNTAELGVCPAATVTILHGVHGGENSGRACWVMEGTLCAAAVQGPFLEKFKKCLTCDFFQMVEAQEGRELKNARDLLRLLEDETAPKLNEERPAQPHPVAVCQGCGQELTISISPNWKLTCVGTLECECGNCGRIVRTKGLRPEEPTTSIILDLD